MSISVAVSIFFFFSNAAEDHGSMAKLPDYIYSSLVRHIISHNKNAIKLRTVSLYITLPFVVYFLA